MDTRSRLERLAARGLLRLPGAVPAARGAAPPAARRDPERLAAALGGRVLALDGMACVVVERSEPLPGPGPDLEALAWLCGLPAPTGRWLLLDLETTGTAGPTGTPVIVAGIAWPEQGELRLRQLLLPDLGDEPALLAALAEPLAAAGALLTYNGRRFDLPTLQARAILARRPLPVPRMHLDLLYPVRRLWGEVLGRRDLRSVEAHVGAGRPGDDVAGAEIPALYARYLDEGDPDLLRPVLLHNARDLLGLLRVAVALAVRARAGAGAEPGAGVLEPAEAWALARWRLRAGDADGALELARAAAAQAMREPWSSRLLELEALAARRLGRFAEAAAAWERLAARPGRGGERALLELAKLWEHRLGDLARALACVEQVEERLRRQRLLLGTPEPAALRADLQRRRARLLRRLAGSGRGRRSAEAN